MFRPSGFEYIICLFAIAPDTVSVDVGQMAYIKIITSGCSIINTIKKSYLCFLVSDHFALSRLMVMLR